MGRVASLPSWQAHSQPMSNVPLIYPQSQHAHPCLGTGPRHSAVMWRERGWEAEQAARAPWAGWQEAARVGAARW